MKKVLKRIASLVTVAAMLTVFSAGVWAYDPIGSGTVETGATTVTIPKGLTVINADGLDSYSPAIEYSYTFAPAEASECATVNDGTNTATVVPGPATGATLTTPTLTFASQKVASGTEITEELSVTVTPANFPKAGVYRYKITDTTSGDELHAAGMERSADYDTVRFLDVYITRGTNGLAVSGYALINGQEFVKAGSYAVTSGTTGTSKSSGYVAASEQGVGPNDPVAMTDTYRTYNVTITKSITGGMADPTHEFPFEITVTENGKNSSFSAGKGTFADITKSSSGNVLTSSLKDSETYTIIGLSPLATVAVTETNDTADTYKVTINDKAGNPVNNFSATPVDPTYTATTGTFQVSTYAATGHGTSAAVDADTLTYINNLENISPTGVIIRTLPYIAILVLAGVMLVTVKVLNKSEKKEKCESEAK